MDAYTEYERPPEVRKCIRSDESNDVQHSRPGIEGTSRLRPVCETGLFLLDEQGLYGRQITGDARNQ